MITITLQRSTAQHSSSKRRSGGKRKKGKEREKKKHKEGCISKEKKKEMDM